MFKAIAFNGRIIMLFTQFVEKHGHIRRLRSAFIGSNFQNNKSQLNWIEMDAAICCYSEMCLTGDLRLNDFFFFFILFWTGTQNTRQLLVNCSLICRWDCSCEIHRSQNCSNRAVCCRSIPFEFISVLIIFVLLNLNRIPTERETIKASSERSNEIYLISVCLFRWNVTP